MNEYTVEANNNWHTKVLDLVYCLEYIEWVMLEEDAKMVNMQNNWHINFYIREGSNCLFTLVEEHI